jgi:hypothetical protein
MRMIEENKIIIVENTRHIFVFCESPLKILHSSFQSNKTNKTPALAGVLLLPRCWYFIIEYS